jgi:itaconate CoA-transferase
MRPLNGVTIVSLEHAIAAPLATRHLADMGARVIKIERPQGGDFARDYDTRVRGLASHFVWTNRSKESLTLDLAQTTGLAVLRRLIAERADVVVQNLAPGAAARLGLSYATLSADKPGIIVCDISGYGQDGPYKDRKAYDLLIQAEAGMLSITGTRDTPCKAGPSIADIAAGMYAYSNILAALLHRARTGRGQHLEISMLEALAEWMSYPLYYTFEGAEPPPRTGASHATIYPYGPFEAGCGGTVVFGLQNEREWAAFCSIVLMRQELGGEARFAGNQARNAERSALAAIISEVFAALTADEIIGRLQAANIATGRVRDMAGLWGHEQLRARGRWRQIGSPVGMLPALLPPGNWMDGEPRMDPVPALGEHNGTILAELGYVPAEIVAMRAAGIVQNAAVA